MQGIKKQVEQGKGRRIFCLGIDGKEEGAMKGMARIVFYVESQTLKGFV